MVSFLASLGAQQDGRLMLLLALPGIGMGYAAMTRLFNRTIIDVTPAAITIHHAPLPWAGRRRIPTRDVKALNVRVKKIRARPPYDECSLAVERMSGKQSTLLKGLEMSAIQVSGIAATLSDFLDVPVHADKP
jgi:hypothetical protein